VSPDTPSSQAATCAWNVQLDILQTSYLHCALDGVTSMLSFFSLGGNILDACCLVAVWIKGAASMLLDTVSHPLVHEPKTTRILMSLTCQFRPQLEYNAHVSGLDALWAGLPLVTSAGEEAPSTNPVTMNFGCNMSYEDDESLKASPISYLS